ncbi:hypothetical protein [Embleya scabrispora]|uniref:hypothetical protein n=1 Tax=Embleya scabrispora TaxID=159449 RepID=UPI001319D529|nr:hypothetical protein [Embleya scabrispora]MYS86204.1 hypothetical protein [Streptomyces sp. SID5474]
MGRAVRVAAAATGMALMTGCSAAVDLADATSANLSGLGDEALHERMTKAVDGVRYVRVSDVRGGPRNGSVDVHLDMRTGDFTSSGNGAGHPIEMISVGGDLYVKASRAYWQRHLGPDRADLVAALDGKYGRAAADDPVRSKMAKTVGSVNPRKFVNELADADRRADTFVEGRHMVVIAESEADDAARIYIPADGPALPFRAISNDAAPDDGAITLTWTEYDRPVDIKAPARDLVVELPNLGMAPGPAL